METLGPIVAGVLFIGLTVFITTKVIRYIDKQQALIAKQKSIIVLNDIEKNANTLSRDELLNKLHTASSDSNGN